MLNSQHDTDAFWSLSIAQAHADREAELAGWYGQELATAIMHFDFHNPTVSIQRFTDAVDQTASGDLGPDQAKILAQVAGDMLHLLLITPRNRAFIQIPPDDSS